MTILDVNRRFYDSVWSHARLRSPERSSLWSTVSPLVANGARLLELGPGLRPRFPLARTTFIELSPVAVRSLRRHGARAVQGSVAHLPLEDASVDRVCALDVIEHAPSAQAVTREIARVLTPGGLLLASVPLHRRSWTEFDRLVGHHARFDPDELHTLLMDAGLHVERSAPFGTPPRSRTLMALGAEGLSRFRGVAAWFEDRVFLPIAERLARAPTWQAGFLAPLDAAGVLLVCRRTESPHAGRTDDAK